MTITLGRNPSEYHLSIKFEFWGEGRPIRRLEGKKLKNSGLDKVDLGIVLIPVWLRHTGMGYAKTNVCNAPKTLPLF